ncbi:aspartic proteinase nepenthesin-1-like [Euphorbia lathyris]|uniref:aspartic proteinase nepenthesin-1-like n=1 Tax=Euphorbia lathyris TaxID=212925 RepID=UPI0033137E05
MPNPPLFLSSVSPFLYLIILLFLPFIHSKPPTGFSLELIHRDSPLSPLYPGNLTDSQRANRLVEFSNSRANTLYNPQGLRFNLAYDDTTLYLVKIKIGTPAIPLYLLLDTGSILVWTQCEPCTHRFRQIPPIYNSTASHTFKKLPCQHPLCRNNGSIFKCKNGECVYREAYMGGAVTEGVAASDVMETSPNSHMELYFGCSRNNQNFPGFERSGRSGGIIGLSMSPVSLLQQLGDVTQHRFSYCLAPLQGNATTFLRFGSDISTRGRSFKSTPIISAPLNPYSYYVDLRDISVDGKRIGFPPNMFAIRRDGTGGCGIDSGSSFSSIIQPAYQRVVKAIQDYYFLKYGIHPLQLPQVRYDLCYTQRPAVTRYASLTFHFQGADLEVEGENVHVFLRDYNIFCLGLKSSPQLTIIGAKQQTNTRFIYDAAARQILFARENCIQDR